MSESAVSALPTVLVVDDNPTAREMLRLLLRREACQLEFAGSGLDALRRCRELKPDLILLDVNMPEMDGFEVCRRLRADPGVASVPILMLTELSDRDARLKGLETGADDFITKPFDPVELATRVRTVLRLNRHQAVLEANRLAQQLEMASAIQQLLLPRRRPALNGIAMACRYRSAAEVGGDFYDFIERGGRLYFVVADVSGHGVASAIVMSNARSAVRSLLESTEDLAALAERVNERMADDSGDSGMFVSAVIGSYDPATRALAFVNCGHPAPVIVRRDGNVCAVEPSAAPIGLVVPLGAELHRTTLDEGDLLCMYTDGLVEAADDAGAQFGVPGLQAVLAAGHQGAPEHIADTIVQAVEHFHGGTVLEDDLTLVLIQGVSRG